MASQRSKIGFCQLCAEQRELTREHIPPQSVGNDKWTHVHTMLGLSIGNKYNKPPPLQEHRDGMARRSLCERCNGQTARWYNAAFADWTFQALNYANKVNGDNSVYLRFEIQPLNVLKQIATMAIAAAHVGHSQCLTRLRRFILYPFDRPLPDDFEVRAYLNPFRPHRLRNKVLTQNRLTSTATILDVSDGSAFHCMSEVAFPPMGYLFLFRDRSRRLSKEVAALADISFFGNFRLNETGTVAVRLPVRIPFGPAPGYYPDI